MTITVLKLIGFLMLVFGTKLEYQIQLIKMLSMNSLFDKNTEMALKAIAFLSAVIGIIFIFL